MSTAVTVLVLGALAFASHAAAAGLSLTWNLCATNAGAQTDVVLDCADPSAVAQLFGVFNSPSAVKMRSLHYSLDLQVDAPTLPDFWMLSTPTSPSACNDGVVDQDSRPASSVCSAGNPYGTGGCACDPHITFYPMSGAPNRGRIVSFTHNFDNAPVMIAGADYYGFHLNILSATATDAGGKCSGCTTPAAIVWNSAVLETGTNAEPGPDLHITGAGIVGNCATVNGATSVCAATPAKNRTWGALKSLYR